MTGGSPTVTGCTFSNNGSIYIYWGGGMANNASNAVVRNCTFTGNAAYGGAGMHNDANSTVTVTGCTFEGNVAYVFGGGMHNVSSSPIVRSCIFSNNASDNGGGMFNDGFSAPCAPVVSNCAFIGNTTTGSGYGGGGIATALSGMSVTNCIFAGNRGDKGGGISFNGNRNSPVTNCTFVGNVATNANTIYHHGGGAIWGPENARVTNCIVWGNQAAAGNAGIMSAVGPLSTVSFSDVQDLTNSAPDARGNFVADPLFMDALNGDLHLQRLSPCRNRGNSTVVTSPPFLMDSTSTFISDLDGNPRLVDGTVDLGAYEVQNTAPVVFDDAYSTDEDTTLTIAASGVLANDVDAESDPLTAELLQGPAHGRLTLNADGSFTYIPEANYHGPITFTYLAKDGGSNSSPATVTILTNSVNDTPVAKSRLLMTEEDTPIDATLGGFDVDEEPLTWIIVSGPSHGTLSGTAPNLTYTPTPNYNGPDSFTFKINDGPQDSHQGRERGKMSRVWCEAVYPDWRDGKGSDEARQC